MRILFAIKSISHFAYVSSIVRSLDNGGHAVRVLFDFDCSRESNVKHSLDFLSSSRNTDMGWMGKEKPSVLQDIEGFKPDVVVVSPGNHRDSAEIQYVGVAKDLSVPTVIMALSWDNLTTKGQFLHKPDKLFVWNETHKQDAVDIHGFDSSNIYVTGAPFFDKWFGSKVLLETKYQFCKRIGVDYFEPAFMYMGSSANIAIDESWLIEELRHHTDIILRPHPANYRRYLWMNKKGVTVYPRQGRLIENDEDISDFHLSFEYASCVFGINTSAMIDAIVLDKPCVTLISGRYTETQSDKDHFKLILPAMYVCNSLGELVDRILNLSHGNDSMSEQRKKWVKDFIRPYGLEVSAGEVAAKFIVENVI